MSKELPGLTGCNCSFRGCADIAKLFEHVKGIPYPVSGEAEYLRQFHYTNRLVLCHCPGHFDMPAEELNLLLHSLEHAIAAELSRSLMYVPKP
jgi:hypothetical protein